MTPPTMPVVIVADGALQEDPIYSDLKKFIFPKLTKTCHPWEITGSGTKPRGFWFGGQSGDCAGIRTARTPPDSPAWSIWPEALNVRSYRSD